MPMVKAPLRVLRERGATLIFQYLHICELLTRGDNEHSFKTGILYFTYSFACQIFCLPKPWGPAGTGTQERAWCRTRCTNMMQFAVHKPVALAELLI